MPPALYHRKSTEVTTDVLRSMLEYADSDMQALTSRSRKRHLCEMRHAVCWSLYQCSYTVTEMADMFKRDHSTICHSIQVCSDLMQTERLFKLYCDGMLLAAERGLAKHGYERIMKGDV